MHPYASSRQMIMRSMNQAMWVARNAYVFNAKVIKGAKVTKGISGGPSGHPVRMSASLWPTRAKPEMNLRDLCVLGGLCVEMGMTFGAEATAVSTEGGPMDPLPTPGSGPGTGRGRWTVGVSTAYFGNASSVMAVPAMEAPC
jgi:hypothetical protein